MQIKGVYAMTLTIEGMPLMNQDCPVVDALKGLPRHLASLFYLLRIAIN